MFSGYPGGPPQVIFLEGVNPDKPDEKWELRLYVETGEVFLLGGGVLPIFRYNNEDRQFYTLDPQADLMLKPAPANVNQPLMDMFVFAHSFHFNFDTCIPR